MSVSGFDQPVHLPVWLAALTDLRRRHPLVATLLPDWSPSWGSKLKGQSIKASAVSSVVNQSPDKPDTPPSADSQLQTHIADHCDIMISTPGPRISRSHFDHPKGVHSINSEIKSNKKSETTNTLLSYNNTNTHTEHPCSHTFQTNTTFALYSHRPTPLTDRDNKQKVKTNVLPPGGVTTIPPATCWREPPITCSPALTVPRTRSAVPQRPCLPWQQSEPLTMENPSISGSPAPWHRPSLARGGLRLEDSRQTATQDSSRRARLYHDTTALDNNTRTTAVENNSAVLESIIDSAALQDNSRISTQYSDISSRRSHSCPITHNPGATSSASTDYKITSCVKSNPSPGLSSSSRTSTFSSVGPYSCSLLDTSRDSTEARSCSAVCTRSAESRRYPLTYNLDTTVESRSVTSKSGSLTAYITEITSSDCFCSRFRLLSRSKPNQPMKSSHRHSRPMASSVVRVFLIYACLAYLFCAGQANMLSITAFEYQRKFNNVLDLGQCPEREVTYRSGDNSTRAVPEICGLPKRSGTVEHLKRAFNDDRNVLITSPDQITHYFPMCSGEAAAFLGILNNLHDCIAVEIASHLTFSEKTVVRLFVGYFRKSVDRLEVSPGDKDRERYQVVRDKMYLESRSIGTNEVIIGQFTFKSAKLAKEAREIDLTMTTTDMSEYMTAMEKKAGKPKNTLLMYLSTAQRLHKASDAEPYDLKKFRRKDWLRAVRFAHLSQNEIRATKEMIVQGRLQPHLTYNFKPWDPQDGVGIGRHRALRQEWESVSILEVKLRQTFNHVKKTARKCRGNRHKDCNRVRELKRNLSKARQEIHTGRSRWHVMDSQGKEKMVEAFTKEVNNLDRLSMLVVKQARRFLKKLRLERHKHNEKKDNMIPMVASKTSDGGKVSLLGTPKPDALKKAYRRPNYRLRRPKSRGDRKSRRNRKGRKSRKPRKQSKLSKLNRTTNVTTPPKPSKVMVARVSRPKPLLRPNPVSRPKSLSRPKPQSMPNPRPIPSIHQRRQFVRPLRPLKPRVPLSTLRSYNSRRLSLAHRSMSRSNRLPPPRALTRRPIRHLRRKQSGNTVLQPSPQPRRKLGQGKNG